MSRKGLLAAFALSHSRPFHHVDSAERVSAAVFFMPMPHVLALLTSGSVSLRVLAVKNISAEFSKSLRDRAQQLATSLSVETGDMETRREQLFRLWEAELYDVGWFARWAVEVCR